LNPSPFIGAIPPLQVSQAGAAICPAGALQVSQLSPRNHERTVERTGWFSRIRVPKIPLPELPQFEAQPTKVKEAIKRQIVAERYVADFIVNCPNFEKVIRVARPKIVRSLDLRKSTMQLMLCKLNMFIFCNI
jgi:hypothetical protein